MTTEKYPRAISDLGTLLPGEEFVLSEVARGVPAILGEGLATEADTDRHIRAGLIRFLALGGDAEHRPHEKGVAIAGARVLGLLDLDLCHIAGRLELTRCVLSEGMTAVDASLSGLDLSGSHLASLMAHELDVSGNVTLGNEFRADLGVDLSGASIAGELSCVRGTFANEHGDAFAAQNAQIGELLIWRDVTVSSGLVRLTGVRVGALADDLKSWPDGGRLMMDGFTYGRIVYSDTSTGRRLEWLNKHSSNEFQPQPYQQLAQVLGEMGHRQDRSRVLMEMERRLRIQQRRDIAQGGLRVWPPLRKPWNWLRILFNAFWDRVLRFLVGYGYRPWWAFLWALPIVIATAILSQMVWDAGDFAPNAAPALMSAAWQDIAADGTVANPAAVWSCTAPSTGGDYPCENMAGRDYETFKAPLYALDLFVPIINLGQGDAWAPSTSRGPLGRIAHNTQWLIKTIGWVITALVAGAVAGVIRND